MPNKDGEIHFDGILGVVMQHRILAWSFQEVILNKKCATEVGVEESLFVSHNK